MSCLGVPDKVFLKYLTRSLDELESGKVLRNLYERSDVLFKNRSVKNKLESSKLVEEFDMFFGPSKIFCPIFKHVLIKTFEQVNEH